MPGPSVAPCPSARSPTVAQPRRSAPSSPQAGAPSEEERADALEGDHIYVYYPLTLDPAKRDDLRNYLLKNGFDSKKSDMSDCSVLKPFKETAASGHDQSPPQEASILEICVYPVIPQTEMRRLGNTIRTWAGLPTI